MLLFTKLTSAFGAMFNKNGQSSISRYAENCYGVNTRLAYPTGMTIDLFSKAERNFFALTMAF